MPAVSVIIPTLQRRESVKRAVASVLEQTFRDFELIVVDNGSTDGTEQALAVFGDRLRYIFHPQRGAAAARNAGLRVARAPLVAFLDSDNRWLPDHLATLTAAIARHPEAVLVSSCPGFRVTGRQRPAQARLADPWADPFGLRPGYVSCVAARLEALLAVGGFDEHLVVGEDIDLWMRLAARGPFCLLHRRTIVKRHTRGGLKDRGRHAGGYLEAAEKIARGIILELERRGVSREHAHVREARGRLELCAAARAIGRADDDTARACLVRACELVPDYSRRPAAIAQAARAIGGSRPADRLRHIEKTEALWPAPGSDTALYLRAYAALLALRAGRPWHAAKTFRRCLLPTTPGFIVRLVPTLGNEMRRWLLRTVNRGRESSDLRATGDVAHDPGGPLPVDRARGPADR